MKKFMLGIAAVLYAMTATVLTSCGSDDEIPAPQSKMVAAVVDYSLDLYLDQPNDTTGNIFQLCDTIKVAYVDENGTEVMEVVNDGKWSKRVRYTKSIEKGSLSLYLVRNDSASVEYSRYLYKVNAYSPHDQYTAVYEDGTSKSTAFTTSLQFYQGGGNYRGNRVMENLQNYPRKDLMSFTIEF